MGRVAKRIKYPRGAQRVVTRPVPAPVGGWNLIDPLAAMKPQYAVILENWFPESGYLRWRRGYRAHATGIGSSAVETVMVYSGIDAQKIFAASADTIYDATATGAASVAVAGNANGRWQHLNMTTSGGHFLFAMNGANSARAFDGASWSTPAITGVSSASFIQGTVHKKRIWAALIGSTKAAYLPLDSIAGAATEFDFGGNFDKGGYLMALATWSLDGGNGPDDYLVGISSEGQAAIYAGTDPSSSTTWGLVGVFNLGKPLGRRCFTKLGSDLALISIDGVVPLSQSLSKDRAANTNYVLTKKIQPYINRMARLYGEHHGWQLLSYPRGSMGILNVPTAEARTADQAVINAATGAWCKFTGIQACAWDLYNDRPFFGGTDGTLYEFDVGATDDGAAIAAELKTAYNYFGLPGVIKRFVDVQPLLTSDGRITPTLSLDCDFADNLPVAVISVPITDNPKWNEVKWNEFQWGGGVENVVDWSSVTGIGRCAAVRMRAAVAPENDNGTDITLFANAFNVMFEQGGPR